MLNVAILGAGIGAQHLSAFRALPHLFNVLYVVDQDIEKAHSLKAAEDDFKVVTDLNVPLEDPSIDLIDVCLPPHLHVPVTLKALAGGKHVVCEKPLATSLKDALQVRQTAMENERHVFPVFQYRWGPALRQLRRLIKSGIAGKPLVASLETHWSRGQNYYSVPWRGTWAGEQGGAVLGHAIHSHDLLTHFMGPVAKVSAFTTTRVNDIETEDCAAISFEMQNGALATSNVTLGAADNETRLRFIFENLTATSGVSPYSPGAEPWSFLAKTPEVQKLVDELLANTPNEPPGYIGFFESVATGADQALYGGVTLEDGIESIELVTAIYQSARSGRSVSLPLDESSDLFEGWRP